MNKKNQGVLRPFLGAEPFLGQGSRFSGFSRQIIEKYTRFGTYPWNQAVMEFLLKAEEETSETRQQPEIINLTLHFLRLYLNLRSKNGEIVGNYHIFLENVRRNIESNLNLIGGGKAQKLLWFLYEKGPGLEETAQKQALLQLEELGREYLAKASGGNRLLFRLPLVPLEFLSRRQLASASRPVSTGRLFEQMLSGISSRRQMPDGKERFRRLAERQQREFYLKMMKDYAAERTCSLIQVRIGRELLLWERQLVTDCVAQKKQEELIADIRQNDLWSYEETAEIVFRQIQEKGGEWTGERPLYPTGPEGKEGQTESPYLPENQFGFQEKVQKLSYLSLLQEAEKRITLLGTSALETVPKLFAQLPESVYTALSETFDRLIFREESSGDSDSGKGDSKSGNNKENNPESIKDSNDNNNNNTSNENSSRNNNNNTSNENSNRNNSRESNQASQIAEQPQTLAEIWRTSTVQGRRQILNQVSWALEYASISSQKRTIAKKREKDLLNRIAEKLNDIMEYDLRCNRLLAIIEQQVSFEYLFSENGHTFTSDLEEQSINQDQSGINSMENAWVQELPELILRLPDPIYQNVAAALAESLEISKSQNPDLQKPAIEPLELLSQWQNASQSDKRKALLSVSDSIRQLVYYYPKSRKKGKNDRNLELEKLKQTAKRLEQWKEQCIHQTSSSKPHTLALPAPLKQALNETQNWFNEVEQGWQKELPELILRLPEQVYQTLAKGIAEQSNRQAMKPEKVGAGQSAGTENASLSQSEFLTKWQAANPESKKQIFLQVSEELNQMIHLSPNGNPQKGKSNKEQQVLNLAAERVNQMVEQYSRSLHLLEIVQNSESVQHRIRSQSQNSDSDLLQNAAQNLFAGKNFAGKNSVFSGNVEFSENIWQEKLPELIIKQPETLYQAAVMTAAEKFDRQFKHLQYEKQELYQEQQTALIYTTQKQTGENSTSLNESLQEIAVLETRISNQEQVLDEEKRQVEELQKLLAKHSEEGKRSEEKQLVFAEKYIASAKLTRKTMDQIRTQLRLERIRHGLD